MTTVVMLCSQWLLSRVFWLLSLSMIPRKSTWPTQILNTSKICRRISTPSVLCTCNSPIIFICKDLPESVLICCPSRRIDDCIGLTIKCYFIRDDSLKIIKWCVFLFYRDFTVSSEDIEIDKDNPQWYYYFLCGVKGIQVSHVDSGYYFLCGVKGIEIISIKNDVYFYF